MHERLKWVVVRPNFSYLVDFRSLYHTLTHTAAAWNESDAELIILKKLVTAANVRWSRTSHLRQSYAWFFDTVFRPILLLFSQYSR